MHHSNHNLLLFHACVHVFAKVPQIDNHLPIPICPYGFLVTSLLNGRVPEMRMCIAAVTMETGLLIFCACADNHVALLFINKMGGSRRGLSIRLSSLPLEPRFRG